MKEQFQGKMLRIFLTEAHKWRGKPLYEALVAKCRERGIAGATVLRGVEGFGASVRIHRSRSFSISHDAPVMLTIVDTEEQIQSLLPLLDGMIPGGLIAISTVDVIRYSNPKSAEKMPK